MLLKSYIDALLFYISSVEYVVLFMKQRCYYNSLMYDTGYNMTTLTRSATKDI